MALSGARDALSRSPALRLAVAFAAFAVAGILAASLLAPDAGPEPDAVEITDLIGPHEVAEASAYRDGQRLLTLAGLLLQLLAVGALALGRPRWARERLGDLSDRPIRGAALAGAGVAVAVALVSLPTGVWAHERAVDVGLSVQALGSWAADRGWDMAIAAITAAAGAALLSALIARRPRGWWLPGSALLLSYGVALTVVAPLVVSPIFNDFSELPEGPVRERVLSLADRAGVEVGEVYVVDASRRSTALNAYVGGLGPTKRVVLYDNLLTEAPPAEVDSVVAHELGHAAASDIPRGIAFAALVVPLGLIAVRELTGIVAARSGAEPGSPAAVPALLLAIGVLGFAAQIPANMLSRDVEAAADRYALEATRDAQGFIDLQVRLTLSNLSDPDPPGWARALFGTHPQPAERIGAALAWERSR